MILVICDLGRICVILEMNVDAELVLHNQRRQLFLTNFIDPLMTRIHPNEVASLMDDYRKTGKESLVT